MIAGVFAAVTVALFVALLVGFGRYASHNSQKGDRDA